MQTTNGQTGRSASSWGCYWGDDNSWKVQYLDLSEIEKGIIRRDERFGYAELATSGYESPCLIFEPDAAKNSKPPHFIHLRRYKGVTTVTFSVGMDFDLGSGKCEEWRRLNIADHE